MGPSRAQSQTQARGKAQRSAGNTSSLKSRATFTGSTGAKATAKTSGKASKSASSGTPRATFRDRLASLIATRPTSSEVEAKTGIPLLFFILVGIGVLCVLAVVARLFYLQVIKADEYRAMALDTRTWTITLPAARGTIYDRHGNVLAISVPATTICANPQLIGDPEFYAELLSNMLDVDEEQLLDNIRWGQENGKVFIYVKRQATLQEGRAVREMELPGMFFLEDTRREYPYGEVGGQIVGYCNSDGEGICGLELYYDDILAGKAGSYVAELGESGLPIPDGMVQTVAAVNGQDIMITIDIDLQKELEDALIRAKNQENATSCSGIVMDGSNGEILAMASLPLFNPADPASAEDGATTIWPVSLSYEPGSTFKTISATALLEHKAVEPTTQIFCPVELPADDKIVTDSDPRNPEIMDLNRIIAVSSNIGISRMVEMHMGFDVLYKDILRYGFTGETGIDFPGEASGWLLTYDDWTRVQAYNVSFGQGISVTGLQMVRFYGALANDGVANTPHLLLTNVTTGETPAWSSKQIITNVDAVHEMAGVLRHVITEGTGWQAAIPGYYVVGKSGTAEIYSGNRYLVGIYNRSFVGYLTDASTPLVCYFCAQDVPYEGAIAPTTFRSIMRIAIERYRVTSDWDGVETIEPGYHIEVDYGETAD